MAKDPKQRYSTCRELVATARSALVAVAQPGSAPPQLRQPDSQTPTSGPLPVQSGPHPAPYPSQQHAYQQPTGDRARYGYPSGPDQPVRLRPPAPVSSTAFNDNRGGAVRWAVPVLV